MELKMPDYIQPTKNADAYPFRTYYKAFFRSFVAWYLKTPYELIGADRTVVRRQKKILCLLCKLNEIVNNSPYLRMDESPKTPTTTFHKNLCRLHERIQQTQRLSSEQKQKLLSFVRGLITFY